MLPQKNKCVYLPDKHCTALASCLGSFTYQERVAVPAQQRMSWTTLTMLLNQGLAAVRSTHTQAQQLPLRPQGRAHHQQFVNYKDVSRPLVPMQGEWRHHMQGPAPEDQVGLILVENW